MAQNTSTDSGDIGILAPLSAAVSTLAATDKELLQDARDILNVLLANLVDATDVTAHPDGLAQPGSFSEHDSRPYVNLPARHRGTYNCVDSDLRRRIPERCRIPAAGRIASGFQFPDTDTGREQLISGNGPQSGQAHCALKMNQPHICSRKQDSEAQTGCD